MILESKRCIITGAASGIGAATADIFMREGARVVIADTNDTGQEVASLLTSLGGDAHFVHTDVSDETQMRNLVAESVAILGGLDVLVSNAGIQREADLVDMSTQDWDRTMEVNLRSVYLGARFAMPYLKASRGNIVNMASAAGFRGPAGLVAYSASKGAVITFTKTLANEVGSNGVRVNAVCPGWIDTPFNNPIIEKLGGREAQAQVVARGVPLRRQGRPEEVGEVIAFLASERASFVNAQVLGIDGGA